MIDALFLSISLRILDLIPIMDDDNDDNDNGSSDNDDDDNDDDTFL